MFRCCPGIIGAVVVAAKRQDDKLAAHMVWLGYRDDLDGVILLSSVVSHLT
jgi:hypothetical protein